MADLSESFSCDGVLIPDLNIENYSRNEHMAWLRTIVESSYEKSKDKGSLLFVGEGLFDGSWEHFNDRRKEYLLHEEYDMSIHEARQSIMSKVTPDKVEAWLGCVHALNNGPLLVGWFDNNASDKSCTLICDWKEGLGGAPLQSLDVDLLEEDGTKRSISIEGASFTGRFGEAIMRTSNVPIRATFNGVMQDGTNVFAQAYLPKYEPPPEIINDTFASTNHTDLQTGEFPAFPNGAYLSAVFTYEAEGYGVFNCYGSTGPLPPEREILSTLNGARERRSIALGGPIPANTPFTLAAHIRGGVTKRLLTVRYRIIGYN